MNYALIFAGGTGTRMSGAAKPKQFLELHSKAIIIHTLEIFENHPQIDGIAVVCIESWLDYLKGLIAKDGLKKIKWIVPGGNSGQESIFNGLKAIHDDPATSDDDIVLIHDGVRPLINGDVITDNIECVKKNGVAITVSPAIETIAIVDGSDRITDTVTRDKCRLARAPQSFKIGDIYGSHQKAIAENKFDFIDSASMMSYYGFSLYTVLGPAENIKITTPSDYYIFRSLTEVKENQQIFGI
jgi:2-C-methyl-D-erythritol 4-phosphate cytidylyltransferase